MTRRVSIIIYHYVRELKHSRYPEIKGLSISCFREQLKYIMKYYQIISMEDLIISVKKSYGLPQNALLLTFDDGYTDHFTQVFPILSDLGVKGSFFPSVRAIWEHCVLDINKLHFILACVSDKQKLVKEIYSMLDEFRAEYSLKDNRYYFQKLTNAARFDSQEEVIFIKKLLRTELPEKLKTEIIKRFFNNYVTADEEGFSQELYMSIDQLKCMKRNGMFIGNHGYNHYWLNTLDSKAQEREIDLSLKCLQEIGCDLVDWVMCYPLGAYNDSLLSIIRRKGCRIGLTSRLGIADLDKEDHLALSRLDTNDLPKKGNSKLNNWTAKALFAKN